MFVERLGIQLDTMILWEGGGTLNSLAQPALPSSSSHLPRPNSKASLFGDGLMALAHSKSALTRKHQDFCRGLLPWVVFSTHARPPLPDREALSQESFTSQASTRHLQGSANTFRIQRLISFNAHSPAPSICQALRIQR